MKDSQACAALTAVGALSPLALRSPLPRLHLTGSLKRASRSTPAHTVPNRSGTHLFLTANAPQGRVGSAPFALKTHARSATQIFRKIRVEASPWFRDTASLPRRVAENSASCYSQTRTIPGDGMVVHPADKASASTTSPASSMLAISENIACCGCAWK
jgi:hypothetical protein